MRMTEAPRQPTRDKTHHQPYCLAQGCDFNLLLQEVDTDGLLVRISENPLAVPCCHCTLADTTIANHDNLHDHEAEEATQRASNGYLRERTSVSSRSGDYMMRTNLNDGLKVTQPDVRHLV